MIEYHFSSPIPKPLTRQMLKKLGNCFSIDEKQEVGLRFVSEREITKLNRTYRGFDRATDVLSFLRDRSMDRQVKEASTDLGDLVVCPAFAKKEAHERGIVFSEELVRLIAHGTLHLLGYDHMKVKERETMFRLQERCVREVL